MLLVIDQCSSHFFPSPYIAGEVLLVCRSSSLFLRRKSGELISLPTYHHRFILCCFGSQPRSLLLATMDKLYHLDIRVSMMWCCLYSLIVTLYHRLCLLQNANSPGQLVTLLSNQKVTCLSRDVGHPFRVLVGTEQTLFLLDVRQPNHHLLAVQHQLPTPPTALSCIETLRGNSILPFPSPSLC